MHAALPLPFGLVDLRPPGIRLKQSWVKNSTKVYKQQNRFPNNPQSTSQTNASNSKMENQSCFACCASLLSSPAKNQNN
jgi:hypothetical protein